MEEFDEQLWARKLETGLEAIEFLEIKDPKIVINEAIDSLYEMFGQSEIACLTAINNISKEDYKTAASDRLRYLQLQHFAGIVPYDFMHPPEQGDGPVEIESFDIKVFQLWGGVGKNQEKLGEVLTYLRYDIAEQIRARIDEVSFIQDYQLWMEKRSEELLSRHHNENQTPSFDHKIGSVLDNGFAGFIIILFVIIALATPLFSR